MKANLLYDIFEMTRKHDAPDLTIGLAMLRAERPDITDEEDKAVREFLGRHGEELAAGFRTGDRACFRVIVELCEAKDAKETGCTEDSCAL